MCILWRGDRDRDRLRRCLLGLRERLLDLLRCNLSLLVIKIKYNKSKIHNIQKTYFPLRTILKLFQINKKRMDELFNWMRRQCNTYAYATKVRSSSIVAGLNFGSQHLSYVRFIYEQSNQRTLYRDKREKEWLSLSEREPLSSLHKITELKYQPK